MAKIEKSSAESSFSCQTMEMLHVTIYNSIINLIGEDVFAKVLPWNILPRFLIGARRLNNMFSFGCYGL